MSHSLSRTDDSTPSPRRPLRAGLSAKRKPLTGLPPPGRPSLTWLLGASLCASPGIRWNLSVNGHQQQPPFGVKLTLLERMRIKETKVLKLLIPRR